MVLCSLDAREMDFDAKKLIADYHVGNLIHFGNNVSDFEGTRVFNAGLREYVMEHCAGIPPILAVDHEGGCVQRFARSFT